MPLTSYQEKAAKLIVEHEGKLTHTYVCPAGKWSVGVGHNLEDNPLPNWILKTLLDRIQWPTDVVEALFEYDLSLAEKDAKLALGEVYFTALPDDAKVVLIDMSFNMGYTTLIKFKMFLKALRDQDWTSARREIMDSKAARELPKRYTQLRDMLPGAP